MNTSKHDEFFNPLDVDHDIHIIGLGATGSHIAELLTRLGCTHIHIWDFDTVSPHNLANQMFEHSDINVSKVATTARHMYAINPGIELVTHERYTDERLSGYIFMCADTLKCRQDIIRVNKDNPRIQAVFDFRLRLSDAQHYAADWSKLKEVEAMEASMNFTQEEADAATPVSGCGTTLAIIPTIKCITSLGVANFINMVLKAPYHKMIIFNPFAAEIVAL